MVCADEVVSYFRSLKSYERIAVMCRLQHSCLPFELRFLGTCLEELGKKDFHELRKVENEANSNAEISTAELRKISNKTVQKKIILYLSLLHSHNYACSNSLYNILCDLQEIHSLLKSIESVAAGESTIPPSSPTPPPPPPSAQPSSLPPVLVSSQHVSVPLTTSTSSPSSSSSSSTSSSTSLTPALSSCAVENEDDRFEHLLMIYTLAINHPAFSFEQKQTLHSIFNIVQAEGRKRSNFKRERGVGTNVEQQHQQLQPQPITKNGYYNNSVLVPVPTTVSIRECHPVHVNAAAVPENAYSPHQLTNASHLQSMPQPFTHDISIPLGEPISIGLAPGPNFVRFPFAAGPWNASGPTLPIVFTTTELTNTTTHPLISRSSSPSLSNSPSRSSSPPSAKVRPLSAPFARSPHMSNMMAPHQRTSLPLLPQTNIIDSFMAVGTAVDANGTKDVPANILSNHPVTNFASERLCRLTDEELSAMGMTEEAIHHMRCGIVDKRSHYDDSPTAMLSVDAKQPSTTGVVHHAEPELNAGLANSGFVFPACAAVPVSAVPPTNLCPPMQPPCSMCQSAAAIAAAGQNSLQLNGFVSHGSTGADITCLDSEMSALRLQPPDVGSHYSNSSNSDATSSDQSSPPNTPVLAQNNFTKRSKNANANEWNSGKASGANGNMDERSNAGDSSSEEKSCAIPSCQGRGRHANTGRGRSKNPHAYVRMRGNHRRRHENVNVNGNNNEDTRKTPFTVCGVTAVAAAEGTSFHYPPANAVTAANVTNAPPSYIQPHLIRSYATFPTAAAASNYLRPPYHAFTHTGELLYHQYPPPPGAFIPNPIQYSMVPPKLSCYNCGSQNHIAVECTESTLEEASKQGQYRIDYTPVEAPFNDK